MENNQRNYGIDLLRFISIFMITTLHVVVPGMGNDAFVNGSVSTKLIYISCLFGVNVFVLISGYVGLNSKFRVSKIISILFRCLFYNIVITLVVSLINHTFSFNRMIDSLFFLNDWWFIKTYLGLFFFMPIINTAINNLNKRQSSIVILAFVIIFVVYGALKKGFDIFYLGDGYSVLWFIILYTIGAFYRKNEDLFPKNRILYIILLPLLIALKYFIVSKGYISYDYACSYVEMINLLGSFILLLIFSNVKPRYVVNILNEFTPSVLSVYIIQCQSLIYKYYFPDSFAFLAKYNNKLFLYIPMWSLAILFLLLILDLIRIMLSKIIGIKSLYSRIDKYISF